MDGSEAVGNNLFDIDKTMLGIQLRCTICRVIFTLPEPEDLTEKLLSDL